MRIIISILVISFFSACINKNKIPGDVLPQQKMRVVMWDLMRADEFVNNYILKDSTLNSKSESAKLYEQVFQMHRTSQAEFKKSLSFYQSRPDLLKAVTDSFRINEKEAMQSQYNTPKPVIDSMKKKSRIEAIKANKAK